MLALGPGIAGARSNILIVGSPAVLPYIQTAAERFHRIQGYDAPKIEITGSGTGFQLFGKGVGFEHPDIMVAPREITGIEFDYCKENGVRAVNEIIIGSEGVAFVNARKSDRRHFTPCDIFKGLAEFLEEEGQMTPNDVVRWNQINAALPDAAIRVMTPPPSDADYDATVGVVMNSGCDCYLQGRTMADARRFRLCNAVRRDGAVVHAMKSAPRMIQWLVDHPAAFGVVSMTTLDSYSGLIAANPINNAMPLKINITDGSYPFQRHIYVYVKTSHIDAVEGLEQFVYELTAERTIGPEGYLSDQAFIPLDDQGRNHARDMAISMAPLEK